MNKIYSFMEEIGGNDGSFKRSDSVFRNWINAKKGPFQPEANRYHLYISLACPWACRCLAVRNLKGLQEVIGVSVVHWFLESGKGWKFESPDFIDDVNPESKLLKELYLKSNPNYVGKITVPVLWDKKLNQIVNNESSEIIRMFNSEFNQFSKNASMDLYPEDLRNEIDEVNAWVYDAVNNGVYKAGFATKQEAYEKAYDELFNALDKLEQRLSNKRYLCGNRLTEADVRLFTTLIRFDAVYHNHFKCNKKKLIEYPNLYNYTKEIYQMTGVKETVDFFHIKNHYYQSHTSINPHRVVPKGPLLDYDSNHNRDKLSY